MKQLIIIKYDEKILIWMHRKGYNQKHLAHMMQVSPSTVSERLKNNTFTTGEIMNLKKNGFIY